MGMGRTCMGSEALKPTEEADLFRVMRSRPIRLYSGSRVISANGSYVDRGETSIDERRRRSHPRVSMPLVYTALS